MLSYLDVTDTVIPWNPKNVPLEFHVEGFQTLGIGGK